MIYEGRYRELLKICQQITSQRQVFAKPRLEARILAKVDQHVPNEDLLGHLVAESLMKRIDRQLVESKNIYVQEFDIPQTTLFYSMAEAVPFVYAGHSLANQYLRRAVSGLRTFALLDIGIGTAQQVRRLLQLLARERGLESVKVIGLDPVAQNLESARKTLEEAQAELPFAVRFHPVCNMVENLTDGDYQALRELAGPELVINSAFTFHHTSHRRDDRERRTEILRGLATLKPLLFTMVEPNSNHDTEALAKRFHNSWLHFGSVFALIDESHVDLSHKYLIKGKFFGREIHDIFGVSDRFRCERHELFDSWLLRFHRAGYRPFAYADLAVELPPYCRCSVSEGLVRLDYGETTIVAVMAFRL